MRPRAARWEHALLLLPVVLAVLTWWVFLANRSPGTAAATLGFPLDDAWIHLVYARNLVEQGGLFYNDGVPETGMTSPLWVIVLAGAYALTRHAGVEQVVLGAKLLSLLFGVGGVVVVYRLSRDLGEGRAIGLIAAALVAVDPSLTFARAAGMEVSLFVCLSLCAVRYAVRARVLATGVAAGMAILVRPEGIVLVPLLLAVLLCTPMRNRPGYGRSLILGALAAVLPGLAYSAFCLYATGAPLPNTYYAKFAAPAEGLVERLLFGWRHYVHDNLAYFTLQSGYVVALLGTVRLVRRNGLSGLAVPAAGVLLFAAPLLSRSFAPGHNFYWERWIIPSLPFFLIVMASGVAEIRSGLPAVRLATVRGTAWQTGWAILAWVTAGLLLLPVPRLLRERSDLYAWNAQNIDEMNVQLGKWIDATLPRDAVIAVGDAGALRYFGRRTTLDYLGLNTHEFVRRRPLERVALMRAMGTSYVVAFPAFFSPEAMQALAASPVFAVRSAHYTICDAPQDVMVVHRLGRITAEPITDGHGRVEPVAITRSSG